MVVLLTHWAEASEAFLLPSRQHEYWRWLERTVTYMDFKKEMSVKVLAERVTVLRVAVMHCGKNTRR